MWISGLAFIQYMSLDLTVCPQRCQTIIWHQKMDCTHCSVHRTLVFIYHEGRIIIHRSKWVPFVILLSFFGDKLQNLMTCRLGSLLLLGYIGTYKHKKTTLTSFSGCDGVNSSFSRFASIRCHIHLTCSECRDVDFQEGILCCDGVILSYMKEDKM